MVDLSLQNNMVEDILESEEAEKFFHTPQGKEMPKNLCNSGLMAFRLPEI